MSLYSQSLIESVAANKCTLLNKEEITNGISTDLPTEIWKEIFNNFSFHELRLFTEYKVEVLKNSLNGNEDRHRLMIGQKFIFHKKEFLKVVDSVYKVALCCKQFYELTDRVRILLTDAASHSRSDENFLFTEFAALGTKNDRQELFPEKKIVSLNKYKDENFLFTEFAALGTKNDRQELFPEKKIVSLNKYHDSIFKRIETPIFYNEQFKECIASISKLKVINIEAKFSPEYLESILSETKLSPESLLNKEEITNGISTDLPTEIWKEIFNNLSFHELRLFTEYKVEVLKKSLNGNEDRHRLMIGEKFIFHKKEFLKVVDSVYKVALCCKQFYELTDRVRILLTDAASHSRKDKNFLSTEFAALGTKNDRQELFPEKKIISLNKDQELFPEKKIVSLNKYYDSIFKRIETPIFYNEQFKECIASISKLKVINIEAKFSPEYLESILSETKLSPESFKTPHS